LQPLAACLPHDDRVLAVAMSPDRRTILTGRVDGIAQRWDVRTSQPLGPPLIHQGPVRAVEFSPDGQQMLTACADRAVRVWPVSGAKPPTILRHTYPLRSAVFTPDGKKVFAAGGKDFTGPGEARLWDIATGKCLSWKCRRFGGGAAWV
jgi:WD40 repeat protein